MSTPGRNHGGNETGAGPVVGRGRGGKAFHSEAAWHASRAYRQQQKSAPVKGGGSGSIPTPTRGKLPTDTPTPGGGLSGSHPVYGGSPVPVHPTANGADTNAAVIPAGGRASNIIGH